MNHVAYRSVVPCVAALVTALTTGCGGAPNADSDVGSTAQAISGNEEAAYKFFVAKGLKDFQAAGVVGNLIQESGISPTIAQYGGGPGRGIAQWSEGGRWNDSHDDNVEWYAAREGQSAYSLNLQLEFIWYELTTYGYGLSELRDSTNLSEAEYAFQDHYEICGECDQATRVEYAEQVLSAMGGSSSSGGGSASCELGGHSYGQNTCTENLQCQAGRWVNRYDDPAACNTGIEPGGECLTDGGGKVAMNTCSGSLQCDDGQWVDRFDDPTACR
jgi:hypothetical protein